LVFQRTVIGLHGSQIMKTAIIIPTVGVDLARLKSTFNSLIERTNEEYTLIVVKNDWKGFAHSVNHGIRMALGDSSITDILLLNDDIVLKTGWLKTVLESPQDICGSSDSYRECGDGLGYVAFWCVRIKRKVFETIGLLDENYKVGECEDIDFCLRAIMNGFTIGATNIELAAHFGHVTLGEYKKQLDTGQQVDFKHFQEENRAHFRRKWQKTKWEKLL